MPYLAEALIAGALQCAESGAEALLQLAGHGRHLAERDGAGRDIEGDEVRERAADVDADDCRAAIVVRHAATLANRGSWIQA